MTALPFKKCVDSSACVVISTALVSMEPKSALHSKSQKKL